MPLTIQNRRVGEVVVLACQGRIVEGHESSMLNEQLARLVPDEPCIVLDLPVSSSLTAAASACWCDS